jgi:hypothetical protein
LQVHVGRRLGVGVPQAPGEADQFLKVFGVGGEMLLVAAVVDRLQGLLLKDEGPVDNVADCPVALAVPLVRLLGSLDLGAFPEDAVRTDPAVDPASIVPDLKPLSLDRFHQMQVLLAVHLAENDVAYLQHCRVHRLDGTQLAGLDLALHRVAPGPELNRLSFLQPGDVC